MPTLPVSSPGPGTSHRCEHGRSCLAACWKDLLKAFHSYMVKSVLGINSTSFFYFFFLASADTLPGMILNSRFSRCVISLTPGKMRLCSSIYPYRGRIWLCQACNELAQLRGTLNFYVNVGSIEKCLQKSCDNLLGSYLPVET